MRYRVRVRVRWSELGEWRDYVCFVFRKEERRFAEGLKIWGEMRRSFGKGKKKKKKILKKKLVILIIFGGKWAVHLEKKKKKKKILVSPRDDLKSEWGCGKTIQNPGGNQIGPS